MRRALTVLAFLASAAPASAYDHDACAIDGTGPYEYQNTYSAFGNQADAANRQGTGDQYALTWMRDRDQGVHVGLAPGPLTTEQAKTAILDALRPNVTPEQAAWYDAHLTVSEQPYSEADLEATQRRLEERIGRDTFAWSSGIGCLHTDAMRVGVTAWTDDPAEQERVRAAVAEEGDRVVLEPFGHPEDGPHPADAQAPAAARARDFVRLRCTKGGLLVRVRPARRFEVAELTVGKRHVGAAGVRVRKRAVLGVRLTDGRVAFARLSAARCR